jgi:hypothetical protein
MLRVASGSAACFDTIIATPLDLAAVLNRNKHVSRCAAGLGLQMRRQSNRTIEHSELSV